MVKKIENMPNKIMGHRLNSNVIPTVCNLKNMLLKLRSANGDITKLKPWEKRSYISYNIEHIKSVILDAEERELPQVIRNHLLSGEKTMFKVHCIDIYLVAYVSNEFRSGKKSFEKYIFDNEITEKQNSVNAIWSVGKGDGVYLELLNSDGSIKDYEFFYKWISR